MRKCRSFLSVILSFFLACPPTTAKADDPIGAIIVVVAIPMSLVIGTAVVARVLESSSTAETKETDDSNQESTASNSEEETGGDESSGENEGSSQSGPANPKIKLSSFAIAPWFTSQENRQVYGSRIPSDLGSVTTAKARKRSVPGVGVSYVLARDEANVMLAKTGIKRVDFDKTRRTVFQLSRKGKGNQEISVPVKLGISELTASTTEVAGTKGNSTSRVRVKVGTDVVFNAAVSAVQGEQTTFAGDIASTEATFEQTTGTGSIKNFSDTIVVKIPKGKRSVNVSLEIVTGGTGRKVS